MTTSWGRIVHGINTMGVDGLYLEEVDETYPGYAMGVAVVVKNINETFLMRDREGLSDDELWELAKTLMKEKGFNHPGAEQGASIERKPFL